MDYKEVNFKVKPSFSRSLYEHNRLRREINNIFNGDVFASSGIRLTEYLDETQSQIQELRVQCVQSYEFSPPIMRFVTARVNEILKTSKIEPILTESKN